MPTIEAIVNTMLPNDVPKPIPVKVQVTRPGSRPKPQQSQNINQASTNVEARAADSAQTADSVKLSPQITALARKEQALRHRDEALKERERQLEARLAEADKYSQLKSKIAAKDYSEAEAAGLDYDGYTQYKLKRAEDQDPREDAVKTLSAQVEELKRGLEESAKQEYEETMAEYSREIARLIETRGTDFPRIKKAGRQDAVKQLIQDTWEEEDKYLSVEDAAKRVEKFLTEEAKKWASLNDLDLPPAEPQAQPERGSMTLSNQMLPSATSARPHKSLQHMSDAERYEEARKRVLARRQGV